MSGGKRGVGPFFQMSSNLNDDDGDGNTGDGEDGSENIFLSTFYHRNNWMKHTSGSLFLKPQNKTLR